MTRHQPLTHPEAHLAHTRPDHAVLYFCPAVLHDTARHFIDGFPYEVRASMAMDLANGRRLELPWLSGAVVRLADELGVATPANRFVTTALKLHIDGAAA